jgi:hypothetical protein
VSVSPLSLLGNGSVKIPLIVARKWPRINLSFRHHGQTNSGTNLVRRIKQRKAPLCSPYTFFDLDIIIFVGRIEGMLLIACHMQGKFSDESVYGSYVCIILPSRNLISHCVLAGISSLNKLRIERDLLLNVPVT